MAKPPPPMPNPNRLIFTVEDGGLSWSYIGDPPDLTPEEALVFAQRDGFRAIATAIDGLSDAIAEHTRVVAKAHGVTED